MASTIRVRYFIEPNYMENAYVAYVRDGGECWIFDPGLPPSATDIIDFVDEHRLKPVAIVLTHAHADHIAGIPEVLDQYPGLPVYLAEAEHSFLENPSENLSIMSGLALRVAVDDLRSIPEGGELTLDGVTWRAIDTFGHSPGGQTWYCPAAKLAIGGDALFAESCGRYDFPHSDGHALFRNIREKMLTLPDDTMLYSGHGPSATIGRIKRSNPVAIQLLSGDMSLD